MHFAQLQVATSVAGTRSLKSPGRETTRKASGGGQQGVRHGAGFGLVQRQDATQGASPVPARLREREDRAAPPVLSHFEFGRPSRDPLPREADRPTPRRMPRPRMGREPEEGRERQLSSPTIRTKAHGRIGHGSLATGARATDSNADQDPEVEQGLPRKSRESAVTWDRRERMLKVRRGRGAGDGEPDSSPPSPPEPSRQRWRASQRREGTTPRRERKGALRRARPSRRQVERIADESAWTGGPPRYPRRASAEVLDPPRSGARGRTAWQPLPESKNHSNRLHREVEGYGYVGGKTFGG